MVTVLNDGDSRIRGIEAGADDFLSKPVNMREVALRVRNAARMKELFDRVHDDITQLRELESLRDSLTHMIIHDMGSPLTAILGGLEVLTSYRRDLSDVETRFLNVSRAAADELSKMVRSLLDIHRMESGELHMEVGDKDITVLARSAAEAESNSAEIAHVSLTVDGPPVTAAVDGELLRRVFLNLLGNAIKFTPDGGEVEVHVSTGGLGVRVEVHDTGPGVPEDWRTRIFEKFGQVETTRHPGQRSVGLGLTFCRLAVEAHGGCIGVEARDGGGSVFWFELPLRPASDGRLRESDTGVEPP
jgi:signal transduction histidine kinase